MRTPSRNDARLTIVDRRCTPIRDTYKVAVMRAKTFGKIGYFE